MNAIILAAGKGSRLGLLTGSLPKPLIQVQGKAILEHDIELCRKYGVTSLFINTHYLADKIRSLIGDGSRFGLTITYSYEPELLGTAGALRNFKPNLDSDPFFVIYGDNYSNYDLRLLREKNEQFDALGTIGFHFREDISSSGVAEFDTDGRITRFLEKPKPDETKSRWVNAGIYYFSPRIYDFIPDGFSDFGRDIFPRLIEQHSPLYGVCSEAEVAAFDTPDMYYSSLRKLS